MPRDLFGDVTRPSISVGTRKWYTVPVSLLSHAAIVILLIAIPILAPAAMPSVFADNETRWITVKPPIPPPPPPRRADLKPVENPNAAPIVAPDKVTPEREVIFDQPGPAIPGIVGGTDNIEHILAPPPQVAPPALPDPVRIGGVVRPPTKVRNVEPVYPQLALLSRVQGIVIIEATIGADGRVMSARVLRSEPLLKQAALDAVNQWEFTPTMLNGVAVPVVMTVSVIFSLK